MPIKTKMELNKITEQYNQIIIDWIGVGFKATHYVKGAIDFPDEQKKEFIHSGITFYPQIIQFPNSEEDKYSVFFEFKVSFQKEQQEHVMRFLTGVFSQLKFKPIEDTTKNIFGTIGYFTKPEQIQIRENHPQYGCYECKFYISPDYPQYIKK